MKKLVALLLAALMLTSVASALAVEYNAPGVYPIAKEKVSLTIAIPDSVKVEDFETNMQTLMMEEDVGVDLTFQVYPNTDFTTKINLMVMSGEPLPDIIIGNFKNAEVYAWAQEGALAPLTEYYNDPAIAYELHKAVVRTNNNFFSQMVMPDGEIYAVPALNQSYTNEFPHKLYIYQPWLDKLNLKTPTTTDELYTVLKTIVTSDPNGNGIADEIGIAGYGGISNSWFCYLMNSFVYNDNKTNFLNVGEEDKLYYAYTTEAWREGLRYIKKLFDEKIIAVECLTQDQDQWKSMINTDTLTCVSVTGTSQINSVDEELAAYPGMVRKQLYADLAPMVGPEGVQYATYQPSAASPKFIVSADCKDPETAFRLGDYMVSHDLSNITRWGWPGIHWDWVDEAKTDDWKNYDTAVAGAEPSLFIYWTGGDFWSLTQQNYTWMQTGPYIRGYGDANGRIIAPNPETYTGGTATGFNGLNDNHAKHYQESSWRPEKTFTTLMYTPEESAVIADIQASLTSYVEEATAAFLMGNKDLDKDWDAFLAELKVIGIDTALEINQDVYDRTFK
ncbi:MAG: extracellular solute-binding protein [Clostridiales bacterium]|nr:extracellular solute-binding protein [Clostridiales bacterium]